jgi:hypothetical protein
MRITDVCNVQHGYEWLTFIRFVFYDLLDSRKFVAQNAERLVQGLEIAAAE